MSADDRHSGEEKSRRAGSFGDVASAYERFRPGPPAVAIAWMLAESAKIVVDLGAGTARAPSGGQGHEATNRYRHWSR